MWFTALKKKTEAACFYPLSNLFVNKKQTSHFLVTALRHVHSHFSAVMSITKFCLQILKRHDGSADAPDFTTQVKMHLTLN